jgi:transposase
MERFEQTADLLGVIQTCRFQGRSAMDFFCAALTDHSCGLRRRQLSDHSH